MKSASKVVDVIVTAALVFAGAWLVVVASVSQAAAQPWPVLEPDGLELPAQSIERTDASSLPAPSQDSAAGQSSVLVGPPRGMDQPEQPLVEYEDHGEWQYGSYDLWDGPTASPISSGTWLERGFWYAEADTVVAQRIWNRDRILFAAEDAQVTQPGFPPATSLVTTNRIINLQGGHPGEDASVRTTLGRFLFRDEENRDHSAELTVYGGGDWVQHHVVTSSQPNGLFSPFVITGGNPNIIGTGNRSFDQSSRQELIYSSRFNSFELNYRVKQRLGRDRMVMNPNGQWRREASSGLRRHYQIGLRYLELREILDWQAEDIVVTGDDGTYLINTDNDLFGVQVGSGFDYASGRWSLGIHAKGGFYVNDADAHSQLNFTADDTDDFDRKATENEFSFVGEAGLLGRWHLTPSFSLRAGWEFMFLESLALAPTQVSFIDESSRITTGGFSFYMGGLLGVEGYW